MLYTQDEEDTIRMEWKNVCLYTNVIDPWPMNDLVCGE